MNERSERIPFDPEKESIYCARCGAKCERSGHMFVEFIMCPKHGEFTIAPVVMKDPKTGQWFMHIDGQMAGMWDTCKHLDANHENGEPWNPGESRVL